MIRCPHYPADSLLAEAFGTQNRHPMLTTPVKSACNAVIAISLRW
jgi:hypothetical protein